MTEDSIGEWNLLVNEGKLSIYGEYVEPRSHNNSTMGERQRELRWWPQMLRQWKEEIKQVYQRQLPETESAILTAMVLGDKSGVTSAWKESFQKNGISHILAVSGLHVSLLGGAVLYFLRMIRCKPFLAGCITIFFLVSYGCLIDHPVATTRAVIMMVLYHLARMLGRTYDMPTALAMAFLWILVEDPTAVMQAGTQMSFGAVLGILLLKPMLFSEEEKDKVPEDGRIGRYLKESLGISVSVLLATLPIQMYHFYEISLLGLVTNLLVLPLLSVLLLTGVTGGILGLISGVAGEVASGFLLGSSYVILQIYEVICRIGERWPGGVIITGQPKGWQMILYYGMILILIRLVKKSKRKEKEIWQALWFGVAILLLSVRIPEDNLVMLDVGQGDGILLQSSKGNVFLIDGGSSSVADVGTWRIIPYLKRKGIRKLQGILISHTDTDHMSGVLELLEDGQIRVERLVFPALCLEQEAYQTENYHKLVGWAEQREIPIIYMESGDVLGDGNLELTCLGPNKKERYEDLNENSLVVWARVGEVDALLTGDISAGVEAALVHRFPDGLNVDVLKVAHHGSRYSTSEELLMWCQPEIALISCGKNNPYGHPHEETRRRLEEAGCTALSTAEYGTMVIKVK